MEISERSSLLHSNSDNCNRNSRISGLCLTFAIICIVDVFGVFPVVSLPKAIVECGYLGILVVIIICCTEMYTAILLGKCWSIAENIDPNMQFKNRYPYSALAEFTYGKTLSKIVTFLVDLTIFGGNIPNLIVASQNLQFLELQLTNNSFNMSFCYWMIIVGTILCPFLWFGSPRDMKLLCTVSVSIVILVFILLFGCILLDERSEDTLKTNFVDDNINVTLWQKILSAYSILVFQFDIHPTILSIQVDMVDKSKIHKAIIGGFITSLGLFFIISATAVVHYGSSIAPSILNMLPNTTALHFAAFLVALQLSLSSAISNTALYQHVEDCMGISRDFNRKRCIMRTVLAFLGILVAESVPRFDIVMSLIGGALTGPLMFIFPPLLYIKMLELKRVHENILRSECFHNIIYDTGEPSKSATEYLETNFNDELNIGTNFEYDIAMQDKTSFNFFTILELSLCCFIILFGILATVVTTYWNILNTVNYITFSPPCIFSVYNVTIG